VSARSLSGNESTVESGLLADGGADILHAVVHTAQVALRPPGAGELKWHVEQSRRR